MRFYLNCEGIRDLAGILDDRNNEIVFQYAPVFIQKKLQLSPFGAPLGTQLIKGKSHARGLPGFIADSLPDGWGNLLLDRQLRRLGLRLDLVSPLERLCWIGRQGMGALEYEPESSLREIKSESIALDVLAEEASLLLQNGDIEELDDLCELNGSSGGERPKIVCLVNEKKTKIIRGTFAHDGFVPWIIKFRSTYDAPDQGVQEYICSKLARKAGIDVPDSHLFSSKRGKGWFGCRRFDRTPRGKLHTVTVAGLLDCDFRFPCLDWESVLILTRRLAGRSAMLEQLRRCVFSYMVGNVDDHAKNFSFLMNREGRWHISPMYDCVPTDQKGEHMTAILGKGSRIGRSDIVVLAEKFDVTTKQAEGIIDAVAQAVSFYPAFAKRYGVKVPEGVQVF